VDVEKTVKISDCKPGTRVALRSDSMAIHRLLPTQVDPLVSLMKVEKVPDATYDMVGGLEKQIQEIKEVIELPLKHPELFESLGVSPPKGVLMYGPPGTGKTLLARAVAHHTDCCFIRVSGSELVQKYIGEGARMVRELFVLARQHAPALIFMDEVDSIGGSRGGRSGGMYIVLSYLSLSLHIHIHTHTHYARAQEEKEIAKYNVPCLNFSINLTGLRHVPKSKSSWQRIVSIF